MEKRQSVYNIYAAKIWKTNEENERG